MKRIAVFCGASTGNNPVYVQAAREFGAWLVNQKLELVYGGGRYGLMGTIAQSVLDHGGVVWGVITKELEARGTMLDSVTHLQVVNNMSRRKEAMMQLSQGYLAFPGGPGTLEEISEAFSWSMIGDNTNPCVFYNVNNYYEPLAQMYDQMANEGFLDPAGREKLLFSDSLDDIIQFMENYQPPRIRTYHM